MQKVYGNLVNAAIAAVLVLLFMLLPQYTIGGLGGSTSYNGIKLLFGCDELSLAKLATLYSTITTVFAWLFLVSLIGSIVLSVMNLQDTQVNKLAKIAAMASALFLVLLFATSFHSMGIASAHVNWVGFIIMVLGVAALAIVPKKLSE